MQRPVSGRTLHGPVVDHLLGWSWLIVAVMVWPFRSDPAAIRPIVAAAFLLSFAHQPLTLGLVYGDRRQFSVRPMTYRWMPILVAVSIAALWLTSLAVLSMIAMAWNAQHTLMQRYGLLRIYGRKSGDRNGRVERVLLMVLLVVAVSSVAAFSDPWGIVQRLALGETNREAIRLLLPVENVATVVFWFAVSSAVVLLTGWFIAESRSGGSVHKYSYMTATVGLVGLIVLDPLVGLVAYISTHAIEYFAVVHSSLRVRSDDEPIVRAMRSPLRRVAMWSGYAAAVLVGLAVLERVPNGVGIAVLLFGALHIIYDGMVWKLRRPEVATSLGVPTAV